MNRCKNAHYKSAVQFFNNSAQDIPVTALFTSPITVGLGGRVTETGLSIDLDGNSVEINGRSS